MQPIDEMIAGYVECAIWSSSDWRAMDEAGEDNPVPLDEHYGADDLEPDTRKAMEDDCRAFLDANAEDVERVVAHLDGLDGYGSVGHDFWLTRNGHGAGFWDRYYGDDQELRGALLRLTSASKAYGEANLDSTPQGTVTAL